MNKNSTNLDYRVAIDTSLIEAECDIRTTPAAVIT